MASRNLVNPVVSRAFAELLLDAIAPGSTEGHLIVSPKLALLKTNVVAITPETILSELNAEQADFSGYTTGGAAVTLTAPGVVRGGASVAMLAGNVVWKLTTATPLVTNNIRGWYLYDTTFGLIAGEYFSEQVVLGSVGDYLDLLAGVPVLLQR